MSQLLTSYVIQAAAAFFTAVLFGFFSRTYRKPFLLHWARAFSALCIMLFAAGLTIALAPVAPPTTLTRITVSTVTLIAAYTHVVWLLFGSAEVYSADYADRWYRKRSWIFAAAVLVAVVSMSYAFSDPDPFGPRFTARNAIRSAIIGVAYLVATVSVVVTRKPGRYVGRMFVGTSFALYGATQLHFFWEGMVNRTLISQTNYPLYTGLLDFILVFTMGLGVVIWLLEEEHSRAQSTTQEIESLAYHDALTGLPNRKLLLDHLTRAIYQARRDKCNVAVYFLDVDRFKVINDSLGHSAGDKVLQAVAARVTAALREADTAMYRAKAQGNDLLQLYTPEMNAHAAEQLALESALRRGVEAFEFELHYQPIVQTTDNRICALESMLRWRHPVLGLVRPEQFIRLAESTGLIVPIGDWTLRTACAQMAEWRASGYLDLRLAVNISGRQLRQPEFADTVRITLAETGLPPEALELEITEMSATQSEPAVVERLRVLHDMGVRISIDDFGTGFSSISVLREFPVDALKIDTSFVRDLMLDPKDADVAAAVIALAKSMALTVVAEGVENPAQLEFLRVQGCERWQGYLCCPPVQASEVRAVLGRRSGGAMRRLPTPSEYTAVKH